MLITRTPDRAHPLVAALQEAGAVPILVPVRQAAAPSGADAQALRELLAQMAQAGASDWVAVTSVNTVHALTAVLTADRLEGAVQDEDAAPDESGLPQTGSVDDSHGASDSKNSNPLLGQFLAPALARGLRVAAVGAATSRALQVAGVPVELCPPPEQSSANGLLAHWPQAPTAGETQPVVYVPQSAAARPTLTQGLRDQQWDVRTAVAYRMVEWPAQWPLVPALGPPGDPGPAGIEVWDAERAREGIAHGEVDAVVATAPSLVQGLVGTDRGTAPSKSSAGSATVTSVRWVAIGEPTRVAAQSAGIAAHGATTPDTDGLIAALCAAVHSQPVAAQSQSAAAPAQSAAEQSQPSAQTRADVKEHGS
ncbi:uroporphyrinogen-III synthase [Kocuria sp.]|uniref:uroporphyrinogen-III synthase n=1 Tax=Kocuria sp. TaxID=1871328 RepID=UPI0026DF0E72|nr:uroporphyrinogen-III synthase [Kocuria sp.]MDO5617161.1 uroporphyrinogen-III synthase [Kocuria sp.]